MEGQKKAGNYKMGQATVDGYDISIEKQNSKGRADIILEYADHVYIFEFKLEGTAAEALEQIERQQYALPYVADPRRLHRIGVSVSSQTRTVEEWEER